MSFGSIGAIERKVKELQDDDNNKTKEQQDNNILHTTLSKDSQLSHCFQRVKSLLKLPLNWTLKLM